MNLDDLKGITERVHREQNAHEHTIRVCMAAGCQSSGAKQVKDALETTLRDSAAGSRLCVKGVGCMGLCSAGPLVDVQPRDRVDRTLYRNVTPSDARDVVASVGRSPVERLRCDHQAPFFSRQLRVVLENAGVIDPEQIDEYIAAGGYSAIVRALTESTPEDVLREVQVSGVRGRGGGGYPAGLKWATVAKAVYPDKYVICNADEGDPGAFMDRAVLESDPHRVLEGMILAAYAVGANHGYVYIRAEYPLAVERLKTAIRQATKHGFLGRRICDTSFNFDIEIRLGAGAFVCGEETALMASIEGLRGQPRPRPPYPAEEGLWKAPTLINNVETLANIPPIVRHGGEWFRTIGTEKSTGTKVFALAGRINHTGLIEVPMGISLREIIEDIGGGIPEGRQFKAVQTGGPSGGCIPAEHLDLSVEYDTLRQVGSIMGSGGMIVMDETSSMVDVARYFMEFCMTESCGKCIPCRAGTFQMHGLLEKIAEGHATAADLALLEELCDVVQATSLCGLGQTASNPVLSTLRYFRDEYERKLLSSSDTAHVATMQADQSTEVK
jgi:bidirectional [NiFe] hydrogenase diaphorase subunit